MTDYIDPDEYAHYSPNNQPGNVGPYGQWTPYGRGYVPPPAGQQEQLERQYAENRAYRQELADLSPALRALVMNIDSIEPMLPADAQAKWHEVRQAIIHRGDAAKLRAAAEAWFGVLADGTDGAELRDQGGSLAGRAIRAQEQVVTIAGEVRTRWNGDSAEAMSNYVATQLAPRFPPLQERCRQIANVLTVLADAIDELDTSLREAAELTLVGTIAGLVGGAITREVVKATTVAAISVTIYYIYDIFSAYRSLLETCEQKLTAGGGGVDVLNSAAWPRPLDSGVTVGSDDADWTQR